MSAKSKLIKISDTNTFAKKLKICYWRIINIPDQIRIEKGIRSRRKGNLDLRFSKIKEFKCKHQGERCFIVATGPSLTLADLESIKGEVTFGMNSITKIFDQTEWRPTYYGIQDRQVYEKMEESILKNYKDANNVFVADELDKLFDLPSNFIRFPYNGNYHIYSRKYEEYSAKFSDDAYVVVYDGYSITYSLIEIAVYMGFKEIYLLGADCTYVKGKKNHFVESGFVDKNAYTSFNRLLTGYKEIKKYCDSHSVKVYNATRGGALEIFPRVALERIL